MLVYANFYPSKKIIFFSFTQMTDKRAFQIIEQYGKFSLDVFWPIDDLRKLLYRILWCNEHIIAFKNHIRITISQIVKGDYALARA